MPAEGIEPPTNGLQNRCSTAELTRQISENANDFWHFGERKPTVATKLLPNAIGRKLLYGGRQRFVNDGRGIGKDFYLAMNANKTNFNEVIDYDPQRWIV